MVVTSYTDHKQTSSYDAVQTSYNVVEQRLHDVDIRRLYDVYYDVAHYVCTTSMGVDKSQSLRRSITTSTGHNTAVITTSCRRLGGKILYRTPQI